MCCDCAVTVLHAEWCLQPAAVPDSRLFPPSTPKKAGTLTIMVRAIGSRSPRAVATPPPSSGSRQSAAVAAAGPGRSSGTRAGRRPTTKRNARRSRRRRRRWQTKRTSCSSRGSRFSPVSGRSRGTSTLPGGDPHSQPRSPSPHPGRSLIIILRFVRFYKIGVRF